MSDEESLIDCSDNVNDLLVEEETVSSSSNKQLSCDFYAVYLLRSIPKRNVTYIGSTPDPIRRLRQHNGDRKGGAYRTKLKVKRPWEMCLLVYGFPNKSIALKFEHAWQHVYKSRFSKTKHSQWKMTKQGNSGLNLKIKALKLLLNSKHFSKFDLKVVIFDKDSSLELFNIWHKEIKRYSFDLNNDIVYNTEPEIYSNNEFNGKIKGLMDLETCPPEEITAFELANDNIKLVTNFYTEIIHELSHIKQQHQINNNTKCTFCLHEINSEKITCYNSDCNFSCHFHCIYPKIINQTKASLIPNNTFDCFECKKLLNWFTLIKNCEKKN